MKRFFAVGLLPMIAALSVSHVSCSSSLGDVPFDALGEGVIEPVKCVDPDRPGLVDRCYLHPLVGNVTAIEALELLDDVARAAFGVERVWSGRMVGVGIARDGRNDDSGLSGWSTAWTTGDAADPDMLVLDTTSGECRVQNRCSCVTSLTCEGYQAPAAAPAMPTTDSAAAILAAFPDDDADSRYDLTWDRDAGSWNVARAAGIEPVADVVEDVD